MTCQRTISDRDEESKTQTYQSVHRDRKEQKTTQSCLLLMDYERVYRCNQFNGTLSLNRWLNKRLIDIIAESLRVRSFIRSFVILHCYRNRFSSAERRKSACHLVVLEPLAASYTVTHASRSHIRQVTGQTPTHAPNMRFNCEEKCQREMNFPFNRNGKSECMSRHSNKLADESIHRFNQLHFTARA